MKEVYLDSSFVEKEVKAKFKFPDYVMMENAAMELEDAVINDEISEVIILCGPGNNGGDGYALSRRIFSKINNMHVFSFGEPKTQEAKTQYDMAQAVGVKIQEYENINQLEDIRVFSALAIVDCIYGIGFHGKLDDKVSEVINWCNKQQALRIACDIPTGVSSGELAFKADCTVTMGCLKAPLFTDFAKDHIGEIFECDLGIAHAVFNSCVKPDAYLVENRDIKLPKRTKQATNKDDYGHVSILMGEMPGAALIAGSTSLAFGAGRVSLVRYKDYNLSFLVQPELMIREAFPKTTSSILLGSGLGRSQKVCDLIKQTLELVKSDSNIGLVLDADFFYEENLLNDLALLNSIKGIKVILTPHPKELTELLNRTNITQNLTVEELCKERLDYGKKFAAIFPNLTLISKGANTYVYAEDKIFICNNGTSALAKAGSGDVLAGLCVALLAQGYSPKDAAITSVFYHAEKGASFKEDFACTPLRLIETFYDDESTMIAKA